MGVPKWEEYATPRFFISVASKGLGQSVSLLFATLARRSISVAAKGLIAIVGGNQWTVFSGEKNATSKVRSGG